MNVHAEAVAGRAGLLAGTRTLQRGPWAELATTLPYGAEGVRVRVGSHRRCTALSSALSSGRDFACLFNLQQAHVSDLMSPSSFPTQLGISQPSTISSPPADVLDMDDSPSPATTGPPLSRPSSPSSLPSTTLVSVGAVLPHDDPAPNILADQASCLTLSTPSAGSAASGGHGPQTSIASPAPSDGRRRACSACSLSAPASTQNPAGENVDAYESPGAASRSPPVPRHHLHARTRASAPSVAIESSGLPITSAIGARRSSPSSLSSSPLSLPNSHMYARGVMDMKFGSGTAGPACHRAQLLHGHIGAETGSEATNTTAMALASAPLVPAWQRSFEWHDEEVDLTSLPNEVVLHVLGYLDVCDLLATSRVSTVKLPCCAISLLFCNLLDLCVLSCLLLLPSRSIFCTYPWPQYVPGMFSPRRILPSLVPHCRMAYLSASSLDPEKGHVEKEEEKGAKGERNRGVFSHRCQNVPTQPVS